MLFSEYIKLFYGDKRGAQKLFASNNRALPASMVSLLDSSKDHVMCMIDDRVYVSKILNVHTLKRPLLDNTCLSLQLSDYLNFVYADSRFPRKDFLADNPSIAQPTLSRCLKSGDWFVFKNVSAVFLQKKTKLITINHPQELHNPLQIPLQTLLLGKSR